MSNHKTGENPVGRKSEVSWAMIITPGLVGPKPRRKSVGDGQRINISVPVTTLYDIHGILVRADSWLYPSNRCNNLECEFTFG
jgi:hypothetical protein